MIFEHFSDDKYLFFEDQTNHVATKGTRHYHNMLEIYFMDRGSCHYFIDNKLYRVSEGDLILIPEGILHKTRYTDSERARRLISCSSHFVPQGVIEQLPHLYRNPNLVPRIREFLNAIHEEFMTPDAYSEQVLLALFHLFFYTLVRNKEGCVSVQPNTMYTEQTIAYIKDHYAEHISLAQLAEQASISTEHLSRIFKKETTFGFSEYLTAFRLQKAETLLKTAPDLRIAEIAYACGFNDSNYFSEKFKQVYGFSPSKLRKKHS